MKKFLSLLALSLAVLFAKATEDECFNPFPTSCDCSIDFTGQGSILDCHQTSLVRDFNLTSSSYLSDQYAGLYGNSYSYSNDYGAESNPPGGLQTPLYHSSEMLLGKKITQMNVNKVQSLNQSGLFANLSMGTLYLGDVSNLNRTVFSNITSIDEISVNSSKVNLLELPASVQKLRLYHLPCSKVLEALRYVNTSCLLELTLSDNGCTDFNFELFENLTNLTYLTFSNQRLKSFNKKLSHEKINELFLSSVSSVPFNLTTNQFNVPQLYSLDLSNNPIKFIEKDWIGSLSNIIYLDLSGNSNLDKSSYDHLPSNVSTLILNHNNLTSFPDFTKYKVLSNLDVAFNQIDSFDPSRLNELFDGILNVSYNNISYFDWNLNRTITQIDLRGNRVSNFASFDKIRRTFFDLDLSNQDSSGIQIKDYSLKRTPNNSSDSYFYDYFGYLLQTSINLMGNKINISSNLPFCGASSFYDKSRQLHPQDWKIIIENLNVITNPCLFNQFFSHDNTTSVKFITKEPVNCTVKAFLDKIGITVETYPLKNNEFFFNMDSFMPGHPIALNYSQVCTGTDHDSSANNIKCQDFKCKDWF